MTKPSSSPLLTKIVATVGPASENPKIVAQLIDAGVRTFRINFSHGTFEDYERMFDAIREASHSADIPVAILGDLCGPKIRVGSVVEGGVMLEAGQIVGFSRKDNLAGSDPAEQITFSVSYPTLIDEVQPGQSLLMDDGRVRVRCDQVSGEGDDRRLVCTVIVGGCITSRKGVNLPDTDLSVPALTEWDEQCVDFAVGKGFDYLALSFVRSAADVRCLKQRLARFGIAAGSMDQPTDQLGSDSERYLPIISKIEKPQAVNDLEGIITETDAVMVARGDLGVEMDLAELPVVQKRIIQKCHDRGTPVIVATQMLESMIQSPTPTRAEVSDVANAIFDGADAVMLSGETAVGRWPVNAVRMMQRVAERSNRHLQDQLMPIDPPANVRESKYQSAALARGVAAIVSDLGARLVVIWSSLDGTARFLSRNRLARPVLSYSDDETTLRRLSLLYGVIPISMQRPASMTEFISQVDEDLLGRSWVQSGEPIVFVLGETIRRGRVTNRIFIHYVGEVEPANPTVV